MLFASGVPQRACLDELATTRPELVGSIHRAYLEAGADLVETATFGANRVRLAGFGLASETHRFNRAAARVAREAPDVAGRDARGGRWAPRDRLPGSTRRGSARRSGSRVTVARVASTSRPRISSTCGIADRGRRDPPATADLPIVAQPFGEDRALRRVFAGGRGGAPATAPIDVIGVNCGAGPHACLQTLEASAPGRTRTARRPGPLDPANAGLPRIEGQFVYAAGPRHFGAMIPRMLDAGAAIVGGRCGRRRPISRRCGSRSRGITATTAAAPPPPPPAHVRDPGAAAGPTAASSRRPRRSSPGSGRPVVISVEIDPPRSIRIDRLSRPPAPPRRRRRPREHQRLAMAGADARWPSRSG